MRAVYFKSRKGILVLIKRISPILILLAFSCIEPYDPIVGQDGQNLLVVDGLINATEQTATVRLSHSQAISDSAPSIPETKATVTIDVSSGGSYLLSEKEKGEYTFDGIAVDKNAYYTLHIKTLSGSEYKSDTIRIKSTPAIDSLDFSISSNQKLMSVNVSTHDPKRLTRYYSWDFIETYEYNAPDSSEYKFIKKQAIPRTLEESVFTCWRTEQPTTISIGTSVQLAEDIIHQHSLIQIPKGSPKLSVRYSIFVKQRAISELEYTFLDHLRKTTETVGGIFGTTPEAVLGNIHSLSDSNEPVLGYFSGAEITTKRFFIEYMDMPDYFRTLRSNAGCSYELTCPIFPDPLIPANLFCLTLEDLSDSDIIIRIVDENFYLFTSAECGDCRLQGGTTTKPDFW